MLNAIANLCFWGEGTEKKWMSDIIDWKTTMAITSSPVLSGKQEPVLLTVILMWMGTVNYMYWDQRKCCFFLHKEVVGNGIFPEGHLDVT